MLARTKYRQECQVLSKNKQLIQDLIAHPGWDLYNALVLEDLDIEGRVRKSLKSSIQSSLNASARSGDQIKSAQYAGQLDILEVVLDVPNKYLKG